MVERSDTTGHGGQERFPHAGGVPEGRIRPVCVADAVRTVSIASALTPSGMHGPVSSRRSIVHEIDSSFNAKPVGDGLGGRIRLIRRRLPARR